MPNPYDDLLQQDTAERARTTMMGAVDHQPDTEAKLQGLAKQYGMPVDAVRLRQPEVEKRARLDALDYDTLAKQYPMTAGRLTDPAFAAVAHDDVDNMSALERVGSGLKGTAKYLFSAPDTKNTLMGDVGAGFFRASRGAAGMFQAPVELAAPALDWLEPATAVGGNPLRRLAEGFAAQGLAAEQQAALLSPKQSGVVAGGVSSGVQSLVQNLLTLPMALVPGGQGAALGSMAGMTGGQSYQDAREKGLPMQQALPFAASQAAIEYATEKIPVSRLIGDLASNATLRQVLTRQLAAEIPGEQVATVLQDLNEWAILNPDKPFSGYLAERPGAAIQTLIATAVGVGGNVAVMSALEKVTREAGPDDQSSQQAQQNGQVLGELVKLAEASKLRERSPENFATFAQSLAEGGVENLHIEAKTLMQSPQFEAIAQALPSVAEQIQEAAVRGGDIVVPTQEFLSAAPGSEFAQELVDLARTSEDAMSPAEARTFMQERGTQLQAQIEEAVAAQQESDTWRQSRDQLQADFVTQLNTVKRFTPDANEQYASLMANFYAVQASRLGTTPQELAQRYGLVTRADGVAGGRKLDQSDNGGVPESTKPGPNGEQRTGADQGKAATTSNKFSEDNRLSRLSTTGPSWQRIRESNPELAALGPDDEVTIYRATIGGTIRPDDFVAVSKKTLATELKNVKARDKSAKIVSQKVKVRDLLMGNDATEFVYFPEQTAPDSQGATWAQESRGSINLPDTIEIDGKQRPTTNSNGQAISATEEGVRNFWKWFGDSKVVDDQGRPLVVYHGTSADVQAFDPGQLQAEGIHLTTDPSVANRYAASRAMDGGRGANVMPLYVKADRVLDVPMITTDVIKDAAAKEFDAVRRGDHIVVMRPEQIKSVTGNNGEFDPANPSILRQEARGSISLPDDLTRSPAIISLFKGADLSTFIHESGHFFLEVQMDLAARIQAQIDAGASVTDGERGILEDARKILAWFGVKGAEGIDPLTEWGGLDLEAKRPMHEQWARGFEAYSFEGNAPSIELQVAFQKFRTWLVSIYKNLKALNVELTDDVRGVMDRMLASEQAIEEAQTVRAMGPLFKTADAAGMTPEEFAAYHAAGGQATQEAVDYLQARGLRDMKWLANAKNRKLKELQKQAEDLRKEVRIEARAEVMSQPVYRAWQFFKGNDPEVSGKLSRAALDEMFGGTVDDGSRDKYALLDWKRLSDQRMTSADGMHPDMVSGDLGFPSGEEMVRAMVAAEKPEVAIDALTDQLMLQRHGDLVTPEALSEAVDIAIHNDAQIRFAATGYAALEIGSKVRTKGSNGRSTVDVLITAARQHAQRVIGGTRVRDLRPSQFSAAAARAAKASQKAVKQGDTTQALTEQRNNVINLQMTKAALDAKQEMADIRRTWSEFANRSDAKLGKGYDMDVVNAYRAIVAQYGVAEHKGKRASEYLETVQGHDPEMAEALMPQVMDAERNAKPFSDLTVEEARGLAESLEAMRFLAKRSRQSEVDGNLLDTQDIVDELKGRIDEIGLPENRPGEFSAITPEEAAMAKFQTAIACARRVESWVGSMDGQAAMGPFRRFIWNGVKDAADAYRSDKAKYLKRYSDLLEAIAPTMKRGLVHAPELGGYTFGKDSGGSAVNEILHAILHTGNESNKRKLLLGRGWANLREDGSVDTTQWDRFIQRMATEGKITKGHMDFVQGVWDLLEDTKAGAQKAHRQVFGKYFDEITANELVTPWGVYRGGYVPAKADPRVVKDAKMRSLMEQENASMAFSFPSTPKGFTNGRVEYNRPLMLDLRTLAQHIDQVLLFTHMEAPVRDVTRVIGKVGGKLDQLNAGTLEGMLTPWLNRSARQQVITPISGDAGLSRIATVLRSRAGAAAMFGNLINALQQISGFALASIKVRPKLMLAATADFAKNPRKFARAVAEASPYMANRMDNEVAAMSDQINEILLNPSNLAKAQDWTMRHAYFMQSALDNTMSPIIWTAAYNQAIEGGHNHRDAVRLADSAVRETQGSTLAEDISRIETGNAWVRLFTQFIGYFNMQANLLGTEFVKVIRGEYGLRGGAARGLYVFMLGFMAPAVIAEAIVQAFRGGPDDEDDDGEWIDDWLAALFFYAPMRNATAMVPFVGQGINAVVNAANDKPYDDRLATSPAISMLESAARAPVSVYKAVADDGSSQKAVRDVGTLLSMTVGLPGNLAARPIGYAAGVADDKINPTGPVDAARGLVTGVASAESKP